MATQVDIFNLALTRLDVSQLVKSVNDATAVAGICTTFYDGARRRTIEAAYWPFATVAAALALSYDQSTAATTSAIYYPGWRYVYAQPNDCLRTVAVTTQFGLRQNPWLNWWWQQANLSLSSQSWGQYAPPYERVTAQDGQSIAILCDQDAAWLIYNRDVTNVSLYSESFKSLLAWALAIDIAGPVSANANRKKEAGIAYKEELSRALSIELNQQKNDPYPDSISITGRR